MTKNNEVKYWGWLITLDNGDKYFVRSISYVKALKALGTVKNIDNRKPEAHVFMNRPVDKPMKMGEYVKID